MKETFLCDSFVMYLFSILVKEHLMKSSLPFTNTYFNVASLHLADTLIELDQRPTGFISIKITDSNCYH